MRCPEIGRTVAALFLAAAASGCGGDAPSAPDGDAAGVGGAGGAAPTRNERSDARPAPVTRASAQEQVRVFAPQAPPRRPDFDAIAAGVDPSHPADPWPGELLAGAAERQLETLARHLASGRAVDGIRGAFTRTLQGTLPPDDAGADAAPVEVDGAALLTALAERLALPGHADEAIAVEVDVVRVDAPPLGPGDDAAGPKTGRTRARMLVGTAPEASPPGGERQQVVLVLDVEWRLARRSRIARVDVVSASRTVLAPPFRDVTRDVLEGEALDEAIGLGALEAGGRTDRLAAVSDIQIAMHGAAVGDLDGNGWEDLVVGRGAGQPNLLFMNDGGVLREEGAARGLDHLDDTGGVLVVDLDGDGARDVAMGMGPRVVIAWTDGAGRFDSVDVLPSAESDRVYSIAAADVDGDGDLDLYDTRYFKSGGYGAQAPLPYHDATNGAPNVFWRNLLVDGGGDRPRTFRDDTAAVGLDADNDRFSLVATYDDLDADGDLDLYVANDFGRNNLYLWEGDRFVPAAESAGLSDKAAGMGISVADADLDGLPDVLVSNMHSAAGMRVTRDARFQPGFDAATREEFMRHARGNSIFRGTGPGTYEDATERTGAAPGGWAWGARFVDWDRDGLVDVVVPNGFLSGRRGPDLQSFFWRRVVGSSPASAAAPAGAVDVYLGTWSVISYLSQFERQDWNARERTFGYANRGGLAFDDVTLASGLGFVDDGRSLVTCDLDQDGRLDLVFRNRTSPILRVLQGTVSGGAWASFRLAQEGPNADAIGALLTVTADGVPRRARVTAGDGFLGGASLEAFFGLGDAETLEAIEVRWPDGEVESFRTTDAGGRARVGAAWTLRRGSGAPELRHRGHQPTPALDAEVATTRPSGRPGPPRARVPLFAEFPLGAWRLPSFEGEVERLDALAGENGMAVVLWASTIPGSVDALRRVEAQRAIFDGAGLALHALSLDGVRASDAARAAARDAGFTGGSGRADRATRTIVDLVLGRTLGPFDDLPLPLVLLCDASGDLACLHVGELDPTTIANDARALAARSDGTETVCLTGGRWATGVPRRTFDDLSKGLAMRGFDEFAAHLRERDEAR
ncbi:MAG: CRTAC1 family protein [Planctomycetota bacterium]